MLSLTPRRFRNPLEEVLFPVWFIAVALLPPLVARVLFGRDLSTAERGEFAQFARTSEISVFAIYTAIIAAIWGLWRAAIHNPFVDTAYGHWLRNSPWRWPQRLPGGPMLPTWPDAAVLALLAAFGGDSIPGVALIVLTAIAVYSMSIVLIVDRDPEEVFATALAVLAAIYWRHNLLLACMAVAAALAAACVSGVRVLRGLQNFPTRDTSRLAPLLGWPFQMLAPVARTVFTSRLCFLELPILVAGLVCVIAPPALQWRSGPYRSEEYWALVMLGLTISLGISVSLASLILFERHRDGVRPPLSILGRVRTRRWLMPRYDQVFVAPLVIVAWGAIAPPLLFLRPFNIGAVLGVTLGLTAWLMLRLPPGSNSWRLTGELRLVPRPALSENSQQQVSGSRG